MNCKTILILIFLAFLTGCGSKKSPNEASDNAGKPVTGTINISGAFALYPAMVTWAEDFMKMNPGVKITITKNGTGQGIDDLLSKKSDLAMISRPLSDTEIEAGIWLVPVAKDGVAPIVNQKNPLLDRILKRGMSPDELQKVFTSDKMVTWGELLDTAANMKASVYSRADESGAADILAKLFFKNASDMKGTKVTGDEEMISSIQKDPLAIGFCNFSFAFDAGTGEKKDYIQVIPFDLDYDNVVERKEVPFNNLEDAHRGIWLGIYPESLCRELTVASLGKPADPAVVEFLKYLLTDGQESVTVQGLCRLNNIYTGYALESLK